MPVFASGGISRDDERDIVKTWISEGYGIRRLVTANRVETVEAVKEDFHDHRQV